MPRPLAFRHLARLHELVTTASICRQAEERHLIDLPALHEAAALDRSITEEIVGLARERGWQLPEPRPYVWEHLDDSDADPLPRVTRVLARDVFELDGFYRETDDEDVRSLLDEVRGDRRALLRALETLYPEYSVPGGK